MLVTSTVEVPIPSGSELISMILDNSFDFSKLDGGQSIILREPDLGLKPELCLSIGTDDVNVDSRFF